MAGDANHEDLVKVLFDLEEDAPSAVESMWAKPLGEGIYLLDNSPFYAFGISYQDKVFAKEAEDGGLQFSSVAERGGHSTYRIFVSEGVGQSSRFEEYWRELADLGCTYEGGSERLLSIDVPPSADIYSVYTILERGEEAGVWDFEEAHVGHELKKPVGPYLKHLWKLFRKKW